MAELILKSSASYNGPGAENYYDFDLGNAATLEAIEAFFAIRSGVPEIDEAYLAELCVTSFDNHSTAPRRATFFGLLESLRKFFGSADGNAGNSRIRGRRLKGKPGSEISPAGSRRRFSFA